MDSKQELERSINRVEHGHGVDAEKVLDDPARGFSTAEVVNGKLFLSEDEAYLRATQNPQDDRPMYIIYAPDDKDNPRNWGTFRKWYITVLVSFTNVLTCIGAGSSSAAAGGIIEEFGVSGEVTTVNLSMYVLGFAFGPLLLAPLSERYGRSPVYFIGWFFLMMWQIPCALAPNIGTIIVCRFLAGFSGSAPLTNTGGTVSDLWSRNTSGYPMAIYGVSSTLGPPFALVVMGFLDLKFGWRNVFWANLGIFGGFWLIMLATLPETRHSTILENKTKRLRKRLLKEGVAGAANVRDLHHDDPEKKGLAQLFKVTLTRPFIFLWSEPITYFSAAYNGFIYGVVFLFNEAFPLVFGGGHGFNGGQVGVCFAGLCIGPIVGACFHPLQEMYYRRRVAANDGKSVPEARMWMGMAGAVFIPIALFWFAWTSYSSIPWIVPLIASGLFGLGIYIVILGILNYIVDSYQTYSASALAGVIFVRNIVGCAFPLFAEQMYTKLGLEWASTLLAFLAILCIPVPFLFFFKGETIRMKSPWAREHYYTNEDKPH